MSQSHILTMMEAGVIAGKVKGDPFENDVRITLDDKDLWEKFRALTNEMIVTKTGRYWCGLFFILYQKYLNVHLN